MIKNLWGIKSTLLMIFTNTSWPIFRLEALVTFLLPAVSVLLFSSSSLAWSFYIFLSSCTASWPGWSPTYLKMLFSSSRKLGSGFVFISFTLFLQNQSCCHSFLSTSKLSLSMLYFVVFCMTSVRWTSSIMFFTTSVWWMEHLHCHYPDIGLGSLTEILHQLLHSSCSECTET